MKQLPSCEFFPIEAVRTNILGTENVLDSAVHYGVKKVITLSTDKAVYPINIPVDTRDLNYNKYFSEGNAKVDYGWEYTSHNTTRLDAEGVKLLLLKLKYIQQDLGMEGNA